MDHSQSLRAGTALELSRIPWRSTRSSVSRLLTQCKAVSSWVSSPSLPTDLKMHRKPFHYTKEAFTTSMYDKKREPYRVIQ